MVLVWNLCISEISEAEIFDQRGAKTMCIQLIYYIIMCSMNMGVIDTYPLIEGFQILYLIQNVLNNFYSTTFKNYTYI